MMSETTGQIVLVLAIVGTSISIVTLFGGGFLLWKAKNEVKAAKAKAAQYKAEFEIFVNRLKTI